MKGWDRRNQFYFQMLTSLAASSGSTSTGRSRSSRPVQAVVLFGNKETSRSPTSTNAAGRSCASTASRRDPRHRRRYLQGPDHVVVREELAKYINRKPCRSARARS
ncbi:MAG: hypothetical protein U1F45_01995 [Burkholderiales bacterium]